MAIIERTHKKWDFGRVNTWILVENSGYMKKKWLKTKFKFTEDLLHAFQEKEDTLAKVGETGEKTGQIEQEVAALREKMEVAETEKVRIFLQSERVHPSKWEVNNLGEAKNCVGDKSWKVSEKFGILGISFVFVSQLDLPYMRILNGQQPQKTGISGT